MTEICVHIVKTDSDNIASMWHKLFLSLSLSHSVSPVFNCGGLVDDKCEGDKLMTGNRTMVVKMRGTLMNLSRLAYSIYIVTCIRCVCVCLCRLIAHASQKCVYMSAVYGDRYLTIYHLLQPNAFWLCANPCRMQLHYKLKYQMRTNERMTFFISLSFCVPPFSFSFKRFDFWLIKSVES